MPRRELCFEFRSLIEIKRTNNQTGATDLIAGHDAIVVEEFHVEAGIKMKSRGNFMFTFAQNLVFN